MRRRVYGALGFLLALSAGGGVSAAPSIAPDAAAIKLDEIGIYDIGYVLDGQPEQRMPVGWRGMHEPKTGISAIPAAVQNGRDAYLLHVPWRGGSGTVYQDFTFALPAQARRIVLRGATAMRIANTAESDGVTFRLYIAGKKVLDEHRTDTAWKPFEFDLTEHRGNTVTLRFENDPGPQRSASFDFSLWGGRELTLEGYVPASASRPDPLPLRLDRMLPTRQGGVAPRSAFPGKTEVVSEGDRRTLRYSGEDGTVEYRWERPMSAGDPVFGRIALRTRMKGDRAYEVPVAGDARVEWTAPAEFVRSAWGTVGDRATCDLVYRVSGEEATLRLTAALSGKSLVLRAECTRPVVSSVAAGAFGPVVRRRQVPTPFYSYDVLYLPHENLFASVYPDWTTSRASAHDGTTAIYRPLTDGSRVSLDTTFAYAAGWHVAEALPNLPNPTSPYLAKVGDKVVYDVWGGSYLSIARNLEMLADYGLNKGIVIVHSWQNQGYDNGLPGHMPPNPALGGDADMKTLVDTGKRLGFLIGLHENYVDYYPNYARYDERHISLLPDGQKAKAWFNRSTQIQSFGIQPNAILPLARSQSPLVKQRYDTNASFLDVHSSVMPWFHVDHRAGEAGAGTFRPVWDAHVKLWQFHRDTFGGPVLGEGNRHWFWSGYLDGVEAQFGQGWPDNGGENAPLMVDFNLLKVHPLQANHGMGYLNRWWSDENRKAPPTMALMDRYRMQELAFGHTGFLGAQVWSTLPLAWLEHNLLTPVTGRYAAAKPVRIAYGVGGKWVDPTSAAKAGEWKRLQVGYDNGLTLTVNDAAEPLAIGAHRLPRFGWLAEGAGVTAWTGLRNGAWADYAETENSVFANARAASDWNLARVGGPKRIRPRVAEFTQTGPRQVRLAYSWSVDDTLTDDHAIFVHFTSDRPAPSGRPEGIHFQQDHNPPKPTTAWKPGETLADGPFTLRIPDDVADGDYNWVIGMHRGSRVQLEGVNDGQGRIRLGTVQIRDNGARIAFVPETRTVEDEMTPFLANLNADGTVVDFGTLRTDGSVQIRREGGDWVLQTYPRNRPFTLELTAARFGRPTEIKADGGVAPTVKPQAVGERWRLPLNGARAYRWKALVSVVH